MGAVLGIGGFDHDGAVSLVRGDTLIGHLEWERVSRRRFAGLRSPEDAQRLLDATGWDLSDVTAIAWADRERYDDPATAGIRALLSRRFPGTPVEVVEHHLCHLASAYFASGFERAAVPEEAVALLRAGRVDRLFIEGIEVRRAADGERRALSTSR